AVTVMAARGSEPWSGCASSVIGQPEAAQELIPRHTDDAAELVVGDAYLSLRQPEDLSLPEGSRTGDSQDPSCLGHGDYWRELIDRQGHTSPDWMPSLRKLPPCDSFVNLSFTRSEMLDYYEQRWTPANSPSTGTSPPTRSSPTTSPGPVKPGAGAREKPAGASSPSSAPAGRRRPSPRPSVPSIRAAAGGSPPTRSWPSPAASATRSPGSSFPHRRGRPASRAGPRPARPAGTTAGGSTGSSPRSSAPSNRSPTS